LPNLDTPGQQFDRSHLTDLTLPHQRGMLRLARGIAKARIGLALGAGGARGMAHIGAMRYLEERGIPIDAFAGTSIGSLIGGSFACGITSRDAEADMHDWLKTGPRKLIRPALSFRSLLAGKPLENICRDRFGSRHFIDLPTPMVAVAADLASGRSISLKTGRLARAVQASMSIPGMFPPVMIGPYVLVDGGVANPVPSDTLPELGADIRIVVNISYAPDDLDRWAREEGSTPPVRAIQGGRPPSIFDAYQAAFGMAVSERAAFSETEAHVYKKSGHQTGAIGAARAAAKRHRFELVEGSCYAAQPGGAASREAYERMRDEILGQLKAGPRNSRSSRPSRSRPVASRCERLARPGR
jgi:predicted acylesterase/phospholipase RssA